MMPPIDRLDYALLLALSVGQVGLLLNALVKLARLGAFVEEHHRRITQLERRRI